MFFPLLSDEKNHRETAVLGGLVPGVTYKFRMYAINSIDHSPYSEITVAKTQEEEPSEPPKDLHVESLGATELFLSWQVPSRDSWNGHLLGYIVTWNEKGHLANMSKTLTVKGWGTTKVQLTGLRKFTSYEISIRAFNSVSVGPPSPVIVGTTKEGVPEAPPLDVTCSQISSQSMRVSWLPPPLGQHGGIIQGYKVYYRPLPNEDGKVYCFFYFYIYLCLYLIYRDGLVAPYQKFVLKL